jgi:hypothetical protein
MIYKKSLSRLTLANCQIKSPEIFKEVCKAIDILEKLTFIKSGLIEFKDNFICCDIDLMPFYTSNDATERLVAEICISLHVKKYGKRSRKEYREVVDWLKQRGRRSGK